MINQKRENNQIGKSWLITWLIKHHIMINHGCKKNMKKKARWLIMKILQQKKTKSICENHNKYSWLMKLKLHITKKHGDYLWFFNCSFIQPSWWFPRTCPFSCDGSRNWNDIDTNTNISTTIHRYELDTFTTPQLSNMSYL